MTMRRLTFSGTRGADKLHIEAPGCIVNITKGLHDTEGREVTSVEILCDNYAGEPEVSLPDFNKAKALNVRVRKEAA